MSGRARRWRSTIGQNREYSPLLGLILLYLTDNALHPRRFFNAGLEQNAKDSAVIAIIATAQAIPVLSGGPDLSVGTVMTLTAGIASDLVNGSLAHKWQLWCDIA